MQPKYIIDPHGGNNPTTYQTIAMSKKLSMDQATALQVSRSHGGLPLTTQAEVQLELEKREWAEAGGTYCCHFDGMIANVQTT